MRRSHGAVLFGWCDESHGYSVSIGNATYMPTDRYIKMEILRQVLSGSGDP